MRDRDLYAKLLGIEAPWEVENVELDREDEEVRVHLRHGRSQLPCPECGQSCRVYDTRPRRWRIRDRFRPAMRVPLAPRVRVD